MLLTLRGATAATSDIGVTYTPHKGLKRLKHQTILYNLNKLSIVEYVEIYSATSRFYGGCYFSFRCLLTVQFVMRSEFVVVFISCFGITTFNII